MRIGAISSLAVAALLTAAPAYAYIDPGTGGRLTQLITGGVAGVAVLLRLYWSRIAGVFRRTAAPGASGAPRDPHATDPHGGA